MTIVTGHFESGGRIVTGDEFARRNEEARFGDLKKRRLWALLFDG